MMKLDKRSIQTRKCSDFAFRDILFFYIKVLLFVFFLIAHRSAINALRSGGTLVYSTCTLSKAENSNVISDILNSCHNVIPADLSHMTKSLSHEFRFAEEIPHGFLVIPDKGKSWGPMFVSKLIKI